jgi:2-keto-4-pentenoate hydratase/2-oxohepta-3-ene-1,7-dioic acid hydratase in catechol pathway
VPGKIICVGLNYRDHAEEQELDLPLEPLLFGKFDRKFALRRRRPHHPAARERAGGPPRRSSLS